MNQPTEENYDRQGEACVAWMLSCFFLLTIFTVGLLIREICR